MNIHEAVVAANRSICLLQSLGVACRRQTERARELRQQWRKHNWQLPKFKELFSSRQSTYFTKIYENSTTNFHLSCYKQANKL